MYFCKRGLVLANRGPFLQDFEGGPPATGRWAGGPVRHCKLNQVSQKSLRVLQAVE